MAQAAYAESNNLSHAQSLLKSGAPDKAILTSQQLLANNQLEEGERKKLLELIADAEVIIAKARHYEDVTSAVEAIETIIKEFPAQVNQAELNERIITLYWNQNNTEEAQSAILNLQNRFPSSKEAERSWLTLGKIHFINGHYAKARSAFLRFALNVPRDSVQGRDVRIWTALIDYEEHRYPQARQALTEIFNQQPDLITTNDSIYARYITLLSIQEEKRSALKHAKNFLKNYKESMHSPAIRLLHADLMLTLPKPDTKAIVRAYELLADQEADTVIGRQAFMRKMMLQIQDEKSYRNIKPAIIALKRIANQNQMSEIEDEAFLHEARLWEKSAHQDPKHSPKSAISAALQLFTRSSASINPDIAQQAKRDGEKAFKRQMHALIQQKEWLSAITLWERFPNFRPPLRNSTQLRFDVARGLRLLMEYEQAETLLKQLHIQANDSVWGEKVMLERARLWLDRNDKKGVKKVLQWLDKHEYTLYRPEMLVIVAHMQLQAKNASAASNTLEFVLPEDLAKDTRAEYWLAQALTAEALSRWHVAARAWRTYAKQSSVDIEQSHLNEANALFKGKAFLRAEQLYNQTPTALQNPAWQYRYSICQLKSGKWTQAIARLEQLKANPNAGIYASMASLTLAEREADRLIKENP